MKLYGASRGPGQGSIYIMAVQTNVRRAHAPFPIIRAGRDTRNPLTGYPARGGRPPR